MYFAPMAFRIAACSGLRTMLTSGTLSFWQIFTSICPRFDAAAVCTIPVRPCIFIVSTKEIAVRGFTKQDAPSFAEVPSGSGNTCARFSIRYCAYISPPRPATILPSSACAAGEEPAFTTTPAPSLPTGIDWSIRAAIARIAGAGTFAVITGRSLVPDWTAVLISAPPTSRPRSDGLIGVASTRMITSSGPGSGTATSASEISSSPEAFRWLRSWSAVLGTVLVIVLSSRNRLRR